MADQNNDNKTFAEETLH